MNKVAVILQARMSSSRLPGKVLMPINGVPMLARQIERIKTSKLIDKLIIATSDEASDDAIETFCQQHQVACFRGSLHDVLDRFCQAALTFGCQVVVRLTGDCPLIDGEIIDTAITHHGENNFQYTTNSILPDDLHNVLTYADGLDVEVVNVDVLNAISAKTSDNGSDNNYYREHVTSYIRTHTDEFNIGYFHHNPSIAEYRLTVDQPEDFAVISHIFSHFDKVKPNFSYRDVIDYLSAHPELCKTNQAFNLFKGS